MADGQKFEITGEFIDNISGKLGEVTKGMGSFNQALVAGLVGGASVAIFEKLAEAIKEVIVVLPRLTLEAINAADEIGKMAQRTGIATEELQGLAYAGQLADVPIESLTKTITKLNKQIDEAGNDPESKAAGIFKALGINAKDAAGKLVSAESVIEQTAEKFSKMADGPNKVAIAMELGGQGMVKAIPLLNQGAEAYRKLKEEAKGMELYSFNDTQTKQAEDFNDSLTTVGIALKGIGAVIAKELLPFISEVAKYFAESAKEGGMLSRVIKGIGEAIAFTLEFIAPLVIGFATVAAVIHATAIQLAGFAAAAYQVAHGDLKAAGDTMREMEADTKRVYTDLATFIDKTNNPDRSTGKKPSLGPDGPSITKIEAGNKLTNEYAKAVDELNRKIASAKGAGEEYAVTIETQTGKYKLFTPVQKEHLIGLAREIDITTALTKAAKELLDVQSARAKKNEEIAQASISAKIADPAERAGVIAAEAQRIDMQAKLNAQTDEAMKLAPAARDAVLAKIAADGEAFLMGGKQYEIAKTLGTEQFKLIQSTKIYTDTVMTNKDALALLNAEVKQYGIMLSQGVLTQDEYNKKMLENSRATEDLAASTTLAGKAFNELITKQRRSVEDVKTQMTALQDAYNGGKLSTAEYTKAMYDLQSSLDSLNPTFAINQLEKTKDIIKSTTASFEGMFSDAIFNAMQGKWVNLGTMVKQQLDRMVAQLLAAKIQMALFGDVGSTPAGKTSSSTGLIGSILGSMFGGFREGGGSVEAGKSYIVGEKRPEVFTPSTSGTILSSVNQATSSGGGNSYTIYAMDSQDVMRVLSKNKRDIANMVSQTNRQYNLGAR